MLLNTIQFIVLTFVGSKLVARLAKGVRLNTWIFFAACFLFVVLHFSRTSDPIFALQTVTLTAGFGMFALVSSEVVISKNLLSRVLVFFLCTVFFEVLVTNITELNFIYISVFGESELFASGTSIIGGYHRPFGLVGNPTITGFVLIVHFFFNDIFGTAKKQLIACLILVALISTLSLMSYGAFVFLYGLRAYQRPTYARFVMLLLILSAFFLTFIFFQDRIFRLSLNYVFYLYEFKMQELSSVLALWPGSWAIPDGEVGSDSWLFNTIKLNGWPYVVFFLLFLFRIYKSSFVRNFIILSIIHYSPAQSVVCMSLLPFYLNLIDKELMLRGGHFGRC